MDTGSTDVIKVLATQIGHEHARKLLEIATIKELPAGTILIRDSTAVDALYLITDGEVAVSIESNGRVLSLGHLGRGSWIGEVSLLCGEIPASSTVSAEVPVRVVEVKHETFNALIRDDPELANGLLRVFVKALTERIRASDALVAQRDPTSFTLTTDDKPQERASFVKSVLQKLAGVTLRGAA